MTLQLTPTVESLIQQISANKYQKGPPKGLEKDIQDKLVGKNKPELDQKDLMAFYLAYAEDQYVTNVNIKSETMAAPALAKGTTDNRQAPEYKQKYLDAYAKTRSENLLVALYAQLEVGALGMVLTSAGVSREEIGALQTQSLAQARQQNETQTKDTMYTAAVLEIAGGGKPKQVKARLRMLDRVLVKLIKQGKLLGREYSNQELMEMKLEALQKVKTQFTDEKAQLEYQLGRV